MAGSSQMKNAFSFTGSCKWNAISAAVPRAPLIYPSAVLLCKPIGNGPANELSGGRYQSEWGWRRNTLPLHLKETCAFQWALDIGIWMSWPLHIGTDRHRSTDEQLISTWFLYWTVQAQGLQDSVYWVVLSTLVCSSYRVTPPKRNHAENESRAVA